MYERQKEVGSNPAGMAEAISAQESALPAGAAMAMGRPTAKMADRVETESILNWVIRIEPGYRMLQWTRPHTYRLHQIVLEHVLESCIVSYRALLHGVCFLFLSR